MGLSSFRQHFRTITGMGPVQFQERAAPTGGATIDAESECECCRSCSRGRQMPRLSGGESAHHLALRSAYQNNLATHRIEPDPDRAPLIVKLFEWYALGAYSLKALTKKAAAVGLTNRTGGTPLVKAKTHQLLQNPIYYGEFYWLGQLHQGLHKPIISRDLFSRGQDVFTARPTILATRNVTMHSPAS